MATSKLPPLSKMTVSAVTGDTVTLALDGTEVDTEVECLESYTGRAVGQTVWVFTATPASFLVLGSVAVESV